MTGPIVTGVHAVRGWRDADQARRVLALLCVVLLLCWPLLAPAPVGGVVVVLTALVLGPPSFHSAARVLRPHLVADSERRSRHACASAATAFGCATLALFRGEAVYEVGAWVVIPAVVGLVVTVPWGVVSLMVRALQVPGPARAASFSDDPGPRRAIVPAPARGASGTGG